MNLELHLEVLSDATFGRGDGIPGLVDEEIEHDAATGLPYLRGRTLKGLLVEECANILYSLEQASAPEHDRLREAAGFLFGYAGSTLDDDAHMQVGAAMLPKDLQRAVEADIKASRVQPIRVLESLTAIRRQTAVDEETGAPEEGSLRSMRVILRQTPFTARLDFDQDPDENALALLAACVMAFRRAGTGRNRGRGKLKASLYSNGKDVTAEHFAHFKQIIGGRV